MKRKDVSKDLGYVNVEIKNFDMESDDDVIQISGYANLAYDSNGEMLPDRDDEVVIPIGIDLKNFNINPVMLFNHDRDKMIGNFSEVNITAQGLYVKGEVHKALNPEVFAAVKAGVLKCFSIGFRGTEGVYTEDYETFLFTKTELFEISVVTVPAAPQSTFSTQKSACGADCLAKSIHKDKQIKEDEMNHDEVKELLATMKTEILAELKEATPVSEPVEDVETTKEVETVEVIKEVEVAGCPLEGMKSIEITADNLEAVCGALDELKTLVNDFINKELEG